MDLLTFIGYAKKFCVALVAALVVLAAALADGTILSSEWVQIVAAFLGSLGVFAVKNDAVTK